MSQGWDEQKIVTLNYQPKQLRSSTQPNQRPGPLMGWVEMSFMGWVLKWGVFGWVKMGCIS